MEIAFRSLRLERAARENSKNAESYIVAPALLGKLSEKLAAHGYLNQADALIGDDVLTDAEIRRFEQWWVTATKPAWALVDKALDGPGGGR